jgi:hypothetical protein
MATPHCKVGTDNAIFISHFPHLIQIILFIVWLQLILPVVAYLWTDLCSTPTLPNFLCSLFSHFVSSRCDVALDGLCIIICVPSSGCRLHLFTNVTLSTLFRTLFLPLMMRARLGCDAVCALCVTTVEHLRFPPAVATAVATALTLSFRWRWRRISWCGPYLTDSRRCTR